MSIRARPPSLSYRQRSSQVRSGGKGEGVLTFAIAQKTIAQGNGVSLRTNRLVADDSCRNHLRRKLIASGRSSK